MSPVDTALVLVLVSLLLVNVGTIAVVFHMTRLPEETTKGYVHPDGSVTRIVRFVPPDALSRDVARCRLRFQAAALRRIGSGDLTVDRVLCDEVAAILEGITEVDIIGLDPDEARP